MLPERITLHDAAFATDGGSTYLWVTDETGREHRVRLVQHAFPARSTSPGEVPGRLYFDGQLVPIRSEFEASVLSLLRSAEVQYSEAQTQHGEPIHRPQNESVLNDSVRASAAAIIQYVESEGYLWFVERVEQVTDNTRYDVWVAWSAESFHQAIVRTKHLLGLRLGEARAFVEQGRPVAQGITAHEVVEWAGRYREAGLGVRVSPEFRWRLP